MRIHLYNGDTIAVTSIWFENDNIHFVRQSDNKVDSFSLYAVAQVLPKNVPSWHELRASGYHAEPENW